MTPDGQIAIPLDKAAIREPFLTLPSEGAHTFSLLAYMPLVVINGMYRLLHPAG